MLDINYPEPRDPKGYVQGGLAHGDQTYNASAQDSEPHGYGMRSQFRMRLPRQVSRGNTTIGTSPASFGIPGLTDADRSSPIQSGFGMGGYIGPIQNAGYVGISAQTPITDPSFGGGGGIPYVPGAGGTAGGSVGPQVSSSGGGGGGRRVAYGGSLYG
jgi:hypothetical protein